MLYALNPKPAPTTVTAFWHQYQIVEHAKAASASEYRAEAVSPSRTIRNTLNLFRSSPPALRTRSSLGNLSTHSNSANSSPSHERRSLEQEERGGGIARELSRTGSFKAKMAFALGAGQQAQARQGAELQEVTTEVGCLASPSISMLTVFVEIRIRRHRRRQEDSPSSNRLGYG